MKNTLANYPLHNYPLHSFTQQELLDFQDQGVIFEMNDGKGAEFTSTYSKKFNFNSFSSSDYRVKPEESNISLFEKLAGITPKKTPRVHAELIKAWALDDSLIIERYDPYDQEWYDCLHPSWNGSYSYRIKPEISEKFLKDIQQGLTTGIATCSAMLLLKEEV